MNDSPIYKQVLDLLQKNDFLDYMEELQKYIEALHSCEKEQVIYASKRIQEMCHVRVLGDLSIGDMEGYDWWNMLLKLSRYAKKYSSGKKGKQINAKSMGSDSIDINIQN